VRVSTNNQQRSSSKSYRFAAWRPAVHLEMDQEKEKRKEKKTQVFISMAEIVQKTKHRRLRQSFQPFMLPSQTINVVQASYQMFSS